MKSDDFLIRVKARNPKAIMLLKGGREVVQEAVDEHNHLLYVIRDKDEYVIESAWAQPVERVEFRSQPTSKTVVKLENTTLKKP